MPEPHLFEYAVIRAVPRVEREEFVNIGVIIYCPKQKYLQCRFTINEGRLHALAPMLDMDELKGNVAAFEKICRGGKAGGPIGMLDIASRFRWLTATRSTVVQASKVHPGLCTCEADQTLDKLHEQQVL